MTGASPEFLLFALVVALVFNISLRPGWRQGVLLAASVVFLAMLAASPLALGPILAFLAFGFACLYRIQSGRRRGFAAILSAVVILFVWLKRYTFVPQSSFLPFPYLTLGLSYILFRLLHLLIEARNEAIPNRVGIVSYLCYLLNFTTFVSGPIQHYTEFDGMLRGDRSRCVDASVTGRAIERIVMGLFKVRALAFLFSALHEYAIQSVLRTRGGLAQTAGEGALVFVSYTFFLYCNFSGYIDVVIGIASLFGITLPENFDHPFSSCNFIEFWGRWHITLSAWLKDYVYMPLVSTLMRRFPQRSVEPYLGVAAYFVTFFLVGVWHGQTSVFLFFGLLQGGGVALNKLFQVAVSRRMGRRRYREFSSNATWNAFSRGLTFTWFTFTLAWFWSNWTQIGELYSAMNPVGSALAWSGILVASVFSLTLWETIRGAIAGFAERWRGLVTSRYLRTAWTTALVVVVVTLSALLDQPVPEIVYGKF